MSRFPKLLTGLFREFRNSYNQGVDKIDEELDLQKQRVDRLITENPQPSEVVDARGNHPVLGDRINSVESQLAQRATKAEFTNHQTDLLKHRNIRTSGRKPYANDGVDGDIWLVVPKSIVKLPTRQSGWEIGGISSTGALVTGANRLRTKNFFNVNGDRQYNVTFNGDYHFHIFCYDANETFIQRVPVQWVSSDIEIYFPAGTAKCKMLLRLPDDSNIDLIEVLNINPELREV